MPSVTALETEWLSNHPGYNIVRGGSQAAMGQAFATATGLHRAEMLAIRTPEGRLAGVLSYLKPESYPNEHDSYHVSWLGVEEDLHGQGYGTALVRTLALFAAADFKPITTSPASKESKAFFLSLGFAYSGWGYGFGGNHERHYSCPAAKVADLAFLPPSRPKVGIVFAPAVRPPYVHPGLDTSPEL